MIDDEAPEPIHFTYKDTDSIVRKIEKIAMRIYGARRVNFSEKALAQINRFESMGAGEYPVCIAKTQYNASGFAIIQSVKYVFPKPYFDICLYLFNTLIVSKPF